MKNISRRNIGGFTLVEILVVVLIIGILSAVAVPMYQGAVDKTHFSTMLSPTRTLKEAQEAVRMATGNYTTDTADLDVDLSQEALSYQIKTTADGDEFNVILATNDKLPNVRLARYLDENLLLQGQLHCEAKIGDDRANKLCGPLLIGQELKATGDGYIAYLLDEEIDQPTCDYAGKSFSTSKTKCYKDNATRCDALGMGELSGTECGYKDSWNGTIGAEGTCLATKGSGCYQSTVEDGGVCDGGTYRRACEGSVIKDGGKCISRAYDVCSYVTVEDGGVCEHTAEGTNRGCFYGTVKEGGTCINYGTSGCTGTWVVGGTVICAEGGTGYCAHSSTFNEGGICVGNSKNACWASQFNSGSICYGNVEGNACAGTASYDETSCCCGAYCGNKPKCAASRCDPQYMK